MGVHQQWLGLFVFVFCLGGCGLRLPGRDLGRQSRIDGPVAADRPVMLVVTLTNTGAEPLTYWNGGPGRFPGGQEFQAILTSEPSSGKRSEGLRPMANTRWDQAEAFLYCQANRSRAFGPAATGPRELSPEYEGMEVGY